MRLSLLNDSLRPADDVQAVWYMVDAGRWRQLRPGQERFDPASEYNAIFEDHGQQYLVGFYPRYHNGILITFIVFTTTENDGAAPPNMSRTGIGRPFTILGAVTFLANKFIRQADPEVVGFKPVDQKLAKIYGVIAARELGNYRRVLVRVADWLFARADVDVDALSDGYPADGITH